MPVGHLGPADVVTVSPDSTLADVTETLENETVGAAIVAEDDEPIGIVTDRDAALQIHAATTLATSPSRRS